MNFEQYVGCLVNYRGRIALITGWRSNYDGDFFCLQYADGNTCFAVSAFEEELVDALPDPEYGILKCRDNEVIFLYNDTEYTLSSHPYEPCTYIKRCGETVRTLHNAFTAGDLPERFARGEVLHGIDGRKYDLNAFLSVLIAALACRRQEMDFTYAAALSRTETENHKDYPTVTDTGRIDNKILLKPDSAPMKYCPQCGKKNPGGKYCTECGTKLTVS